VSELIGKGIAELLGSLAAELRLCRKREPRNKKCICYGHSEDGCGEPEPAVRGLPVILKVGKILSNLVVRISFVACIEVRGENLRAENFACGLITARLDEVGDVRIAWLCKVGTFRSDKTNDL
jgi:hypothetical protein